MMRRLLLLLLVSVLPATGVWSQPGPGPQPGGPVTAAAGAYAAGSVVDIGTSSSPAANTVNWNLGQIKTTLGFPFQAGGSIGNTGFSINGTLPAYASTPTFNLGTGGPSNYSLETGGNLASILAKIPAQNGDGGALSHVTNFPATQPVSAASLPLPSGAATAANQTAVQAPAGSSSTSATGVQGVSGGLPVSVAGAASNAGSIATSSTNLPSLGFNYGLNLGGDHWLPILATTISGYNYLGMDAPTGGNLISAINAGVGLFTSTNPPQGLAFGYNLSGVFTQAKGSSVGMNVDVTGQTLTSYLVDSGGTNKATVKAASTPAVATDPALVVTKSPSDFSPSTGGSVPVSVAAATTTQLVALAGGKAIYVTAFDFITAGTLNVTLEYGTGSLCATGTTALTGAYPLSTNSPGIARGNGGATLLFVPAGNALCVVTSAAPQLSGSLTYQQF